MENQSPDEYKKNIARSQQLLDGQKPSDVKMGIDMLFDLLNADPEAHDIYPIIIRAGQEHPEFSGYIYGRLGILDKKGVGSAHQVLLEQTPSQTRQASDTDKSLGDSEHSLQNMVTQADDAYYSAEYVRAIQLYEEILKADPQNERVREQLSKAELKRQEYLAKNLPREAINFYQRSRSHINASDIHGAAILLEEALAIAEKSNIPFPQAQSLYDSLQDALIAAEYKQAAQIALTENRWEDAIQQLKYALSLDDGDFYAKNLLQQIELLLEIGSGLSLLMKDDFEQQNQEFDSIKNQFENIGYYHALDNLYLEIAKQLQFTKERLDKWKNFYEHMARGKHSLDIEDYKSAIGSFSQAVELFQNNPKLLPPSDLDDAFYYHSLADTLHLELVTLEKGYTDAQRVLQEGDSCTAVDILLRILQQPPRGNRAKSLAAEARKLKKKVLVLCAEKISSRGGYQRARAILEPYADEEPIVKKSLEKITERHNQEMAEKAVQNKELMDDYKRWSRTRFVLSIAASILCGLLLIGGVFSAFMGNLSPAIISSLSAVIPGVIVAVFFTQEEKIRVERFKIITKTPEEEKLDSKALSKAFGLSDDLQHKTDNVTKEIDV